MAVTKALSLHGIHSQYGTLPNLLTTINTLVDVGIVVTALLRTKHFQFNATTNSLTVAILGSVDGGVTFPITVAAEFPVATGATPVMKVDTTFYTHLKVQVRPTVGGSHGTLTTKWAGASF